MSTESIKFALRQRFHYDVPLLLAVLSLLALGLTMVTSASLHLGAKMSDSIAHYPLRQTIHILLGLMCGSFVMIVPLRSWEKLSRPLFLVGLLLLVLVLVVGVKVNGSTRWLSLGGFRIQVSEVMKFIAVIYMASYINRHLQHIRESAFGLLRPLMLFSVASLLLLMEPDFGSAVVLLIIVMGMMFLAGARLWQFVALLTLVASLGALLIYVSPYRLARVTSFINPWADAKNTGFQLAQALIAFGQGEFFGVGLGNGVQKLFYLPEAHTDFLFSVMAEELGLVGLLTTISLFALMVWRAFEIAEKAVQAGQIFAAQIAQGLGLWFGFQSFVNMGVNMGLLPTKGLTLPLMSYGGGSMIVMCCAMALLFRINYEAEEQIKNSVRGKV